MVGKGESYKETAQRKKGRGTEAKRRRVWATAAEKRTGSSSTAAAGNEQRKSRKTKDKEESGNWPRLVPGSSFALGGAVERRPDSASTRAAARLSSSALPARTDPNPVARRPSLTAAAASASAPSTRARTSTSSEHDQPAPARPPLPRRSRPRAPRPSSKSHPPCHKTRPSPEPASQPSLSLPYRPACTNATTHAPPAPLLRTHSFPGTSSSLRPLALPPLKPAAPTTSLILPFPSRAGPQKTLPSCGLFPPPCPLRPAAPKRAPASHKPAATMVSLRSPHAHTHTHTHDHHALPTAYTPEGKPSHV